MNWLEFRNVSKQFSGHLAVDDASFSAQEGEIICLVGPSGCGKTTALRMIAGFETPTSGEIWLGGHEVSTLPAHKRNIGITFQNYALFPHMTVAANVGFGLRMRKFGREESRAKVAAALAMVRLDGLDARYPSQLSGGQQQRVALARAIVIEPVMLLLDEPLSNLDAMLREEMRVEIKEIQSRLKITTVFVTHDQEEALTISDRIAVMQAGQVVQEGTPVEVFERPQHSFVASFIGQSNLLRGVAAAEVDGHVGMRTHSGIDLHGRPIKPIEPGTPALAVIRHSRVRVEKPDSPDSDGSDKAGPNVFSGRVELINYLGDSVQYVCSLGDAERIIATVAIANAADIALAAGDDVRISWPAGDCLVVADASMPDQDDD